MGFNGSKAVMVTWSFIWVAFGGACGAVIRYIVGLSIGFPYATLSINVLGCFLMGVLFVYLEHKEFDRWQPFLVIGFLGGFTTFSAFSLDTLKLYQDDRYLAAGGYIVASVFLSLLALTVGFLIARELLT